MLRPITSQGFDGLYVLCKDGKPVEVGDWVDGTSFSSGSYFNSGTLQGGRAPLHEGRKGFVYVQVGASSRELCPAVYGLSWEPDGFTVTL